jgi:pyruvate, water dikinase
MTEESGDKSGGSDEGVNVKVDFVKWFSELNKNSGPVSGGKGANLGEMYNAKVPVPNGFVVTAQAYDYFIEKAGIGAKISELLSTIDYENTDQLNKTVEAVRKLITDAEMPSEMKEEIIESYDHLGTNKLDVEKGSAYDILANAAEPVFVAVRSSATTEDLAEASFAGQQDTYLNIKGNDKLIDAVKRCFASLFTSRATYYRNKQGFKHEEAHLAVVVQKMINSDKSGVVFSKDPNYTGDDVIIEAVFGLGEGIVSGMITPDHYVVSKDLEIVSKKVEDKKKAIVRSSSGENRIVNLGPDATKMQVLKDHEIKRIADLSIKLEEHYDKPQDSEFAIENGEVFMVQTRPITTVGKRVDRKEEQKIDGEIVLTGLAASPGIASGTVKIIHDLKDLSKIVKGDVLVTSMTNPDMVVSMQKSAAIVTDEGGLTAHASIVSREMGIPAIVGTREATTKLKDGEIVTVDGYSGKVYKGKVAESEKKEVLPVEAVTKTKVKVIVDLPSFAERASKTGLKRVGLTRIEGIIAESGKHPELFLGKDTKEYEEIVFKGVEGIAKYFDEMWVRTSDIRSDEFANLEGAPPKDEANPMLGMHGIRYSLKHPELLKAELNALKRIAGQGKTIGILMPQVISVEELQGCKKILKEIEFSDCKVGIMIETPAAVQMIKEFCEEGIDFISFGTNDLTQYMLAIDRGNEKVQHLYNEMHPAILKQMEYVIRICKRYNVESSICGQAGSKKEMAKFLVGVGINSISVNADMAKEISDYIAELEGGTDKEPRDYEKHKEKVERAEPVVESEKVEEKESVEEEKVEEVKEEKKVEEIKEESVENNVEGVEDDVEEKVEEVNEEKIEEGIEDKLALDEKRIEEDIRVIEEEKQEYLGSSENDEGENDEGEKVEEEDLEGEEKELVTDESVEEKNGKESKENGEDLEKGKEEKDLGNEEENGEVEEEVNKSENEDDDSDEEVSGEKPNSEDVKGDTLGIF